MSTRSGTASPRAAPARPHLGGPPPGVGRHLAIEEPPALSGSGCPVEGEDEVLGGHRAPLPPPEAGVVMEADVGPQAEGVGPAVRAHLGHLRRQGGLELVGPGVGVVLQQPLVDLGGQHPRRALADEGRVEALGQGVEVGVDPPRPPRGRVGLAAEGGQHGGGSGGVGGRRGSLTASQADPSGAAATPLSPPGPGGRRAPQAPDAPPRPAPARRLPDIIGDVHGAWRPPRPARPPRRGSTPARRPAPSSSWGTRRSRPGLTRRGGSGAAPRRGRRGALHHRQPRAQPHAGSAQGGQRWAWGDADDGHPRSWMFLRVCASAPRWRRPPSGMPSSTSSDPSAGPGPP